MIKKIILGLSLGVVVVLVVMIGLTRENPQPPSTPQPLTAPDRYFMQPIWSPDGKLLAAAGENYRGIWLMDRDGGNLRQITADEGAGYKFAWSPDSQEIVARVQKRENRRRRNLIKIYNSKTGQERLLKEYASRISELPKWTANGAQIAIYTPKGLELLNAGGTDAQSDQTASVDATSLLVAASNELVVANTGGQILSRAKPVDGTYLNAALSPDGKHIVFEVLGGNLYVVDVDGKNLLDLGPGERPCWSPDSKRIAFVIPKDDGHELLSSDIYLIARDGSGKRNLTDSPDAIEMNPNWSPDGRTLVFDEKKSGRLYKLELPES